MENENPLEEIQKSVQLEYDEVVKSLREVTLMLDQSKGEVAKLSQRSTAITSHLQQLQAKAGSASAEEIRMAYDSALDAQQRLFVMRGQLEKLQNDQNHLERYKSTMERVRSALGQDFSTKAAPSKGMPPSMEMVVNAQESERQRLSRQMHDGPAQALSNFILQAEIAGRLMDVDPAQAREELNNLKATAMGTLQKVRNFIAELRPMMLDDLGLAPTIRRYIDTFKDQSGLEVSATVSGAERRFEPFVEVMIFRALQELLGNAARYSQATLVKVFVDIGDSSVKLTVDDNGRGFDTETLEQSGSLGIKLIRDRVEMLGGVFELDSVLGKGTRVSFSVPVK
jgi:two-component system sensor histidine kinase DegS